MKPKTRSNENFNSIVTILKELNKLYPTQGIGRHIHDSTLGYNNLWGMADKELLFALTKYKAELELNIVDEDDVREILEDAEHLMDDSDPDFNLTDDTEFDVD